MDIINKYRKASSIKMAIGLILVGLIFAVIAGIGIASPDKATETVSAKITDIQIGGTDEEPEYHVFVSYEIDGKKYENELGAYDSSWKVGDVIECKYDPADPETLTTGNGKLFAVVFCVIGVAAIAIGVYMLVKSVKKPSGDYAQFDRVNENSIDPAKKAEVENNTETLRDYVFHFTGKLNQSYVMKDNVGREVFKADCGGIKLIQDTDFEFVNVQTGEKIPRKISHTVTTTNGSISTVFPSVSSSFNFDGKNCWDFLAEMGYGFEFSLKGLRPHYEVKHYGVGVGSIDSAGTEVLKPEYEGNPLAKIPTKGIYRISCKPSEVEGIFYICFALSQTETTVA